MFARKRTTIATVRTSSIPRAPHATASRSSSLVASSRLFGLNLPRVQVQAPRPNLDRHLLRHLPRPRRLRLLLQSLRLLTQAHLRHLRPRPLRARPRLLLRWQRPRLPLLASAMPCSAQFRVVHGCERQPRTIVAPLLYRGVSSVTLPLPHISTLHLALSHLPLLNLP